MRRPPPPHPRGTPRTAGSGRRRGTPNRKTVELRQLMASLATTSTIRTGCARLPATSRSPRPRELVWAHVVGKPTERVQLSADVTMSQKLDQERELFSKLSLEQLEELAARYAGARRQGDGRW